jgi:hypothetical protein
MPSPDIALAQGDGNRLDVFFFHPILKGDGFFRQRNMAESSLPCQTPCNTIARGWKCGLLLTNFSHIPAPSSGKSVASNG